MNDPAGKHSTLFYFFFQSVDSTRDPWQHKAIKKILMKTLVERDYAIPGLYHRESVDYLSSLEAIAWLFLCAITNISFDFVASVGD